MGETIVLLCSWGMSDVGESREARCVLPAYVIGEIDKAAADFGKAHNKAMVEKMS